MTHAERKELVEAYYSYCGFGKIDISHVQSKGGFVETTSEHYSIAWKRIYGEALGSDGVCYFTMGFLCGATEAIHDIALGTFDAKQIRCLAKGDKSIRIDVFRGLRKKLKESIGEGVPQSFESQPSNSETSVNYTEVMDALLSNDLAGDEETGLIEAYGGLITRHYSNYYNLINVRVLMQLEKKYKRDGILKAKSIAIKSAQTSAMYLLSNLISSAEWKKHIAPSVKTTEDQLHGILAFINTLGWGKWEIERFNPEGKTSFNITASSESNAFLKMVGKTKAPICFFLEGMVSGIMNMVYNNKLAPKMKLDADVFNKVFKSDTRYVVTEARTRMTGEETDRFTVARKQ